MIPKMKQEVNIPLFRKELLNVLRGNILPYWTDHMTEPGGGFYGRCDGYDCLDTAAPKGAVLYARILWTFATAYRILGDTTYLQTALRAERYIAEHFMDSEFGGVYWSLTCDGNPLDTKKQFYALGFMLYGLAAFYRATGDPVALQQAIALFRTIEEHSRDCLFGGYIEATTRSWAPIPDMRLSSKDRNTCKTMNTHLHILEAYAELYRVWPDSALHDALVALLELFFAKIEDAENHHLRLFFQEDWHPVGRAISYGHDIEASWLLLDAARILQHSELQQRALQHTDRIATAALDGLCDDASLRYGVRDDGTDDLDRHWWVEAECVVGQLYHWKYHGHSESLTGAWRTWKYIERNMVDWEHGEWYWIRRGKDGTIDRREDKAGFWKCPYHNSRMVLQAVVHLLVGE